MLTNESKRTGKSVRELEQDFLRSHVLHRLFSASRNPKRLQVVYACSDVASATSGATLRVEGGIVTGLG
jgi:hypothetical protein